MLNLKLLFSISTIVIIGEALSFEEGLRKRNYCLADWVARVKIEIQHPEPIMTEEAERTGIKVIRYTVSYPTVYKAPGNRYRSLSTDIYTYGDGSPCAFQFDVGKEYLLAGYISSERLWTGRCRQILPNYPHEAMLREPLEWRQVPTFITKELETKGFEPCDPIPSLRPMISLESNALKLTAKNEINSAGGKIISFHIVVLLSVWIL